LFPIVCEQSPKAVSLDLLAAIQAELIQPLSEFRANASYLLIKTKEDLKMT
jgi:hypothetical protein